MAALFSSQSKSGGFGKKNYGSYYQSTDEMDQLNDDDEWEAVVFYLRKEDVARGQAGGVSGSKSPKEAAIRARRFVLGDNKKEAPAWCKVPLQMLFPDSIPNTSTSKTTMMESFTGSTQESTGDVSDTADGNLRRASSNHMKDGEGDDSESTEDDSDNSDGDLRRASYRMKDGEVVDSDKKQMDPQRPTKSPAVSKIANSTELAYSKAQTIRALTYLSKSLENRKKVNKTKMEAAKKAQTNNIPVAETKAKPVEKPATDAQQQQQQQQRKSSKVTLARRPLEADSDALLDHACSLGNFCIKPHVISGTDNQEVEFDIHEEVGQKKNGRWFDIKDEVDNDAQVPIEEEDVREEVDNDNEARVPIEEGNVREEADDDSGILIEESKKSPERYYQGPIDLDELEDEIEKQKLHYKLNKFARGFSLARSKAVAANMQRILQARRLLRDANKNNAPTSPVVTYYLPEQQETRVDEALINASPPKMSRHVAFPNEPPLSNELKNRPVHFLFDQNDEDEDANKTGEYIETMLPDTMNRAKSLSSSKKVVYNRIPTPSSSAPQQRTRSDQESSCEEEPTSAAKGRDVDTCVKGREECRASSGRWFRPELLFHGIATPKRDLDSVDSFETNNTMLDDKSEDIFVAQISDTKVKNKKKKKNGRRRNNPASNSKRSEAVLHMLSSLSSDTESETSSNIIGYTGDSEHGLVARNRHINISSAPLPTNVLSFDENKVQERVARAKEYYTKGEGEFIEFIPDSFSVIEEPDDESPKNKIGERKKKRFARLFGKKSSSSSKWSKITAKKSPRISSSPKRKTHEEVCNKTTNHTSKRPSLTSPKQDTPQAIQTPKKSLSPPGDELSEPGAHDHDTPQSDVAVEKTAMGRQPETTLTKRTGNQGCCFPSVVDNTPGWKDKTLELEPQSPTRSEASTKAMSHRTRRRLQAEAAAMAGAGSKSAYSLPTYVSEYDEGRLGPCAGLFGPEYVSFDDQDSDDGIVTMTSRSQGDNDIMGAARSRIAADEAAEQALHAAEYATEASRLAAAKSHQANSQSARYSSSSRDEEALAVPLVRTSSTLSFSRKNPTLRSPSVAVNANAFFPEAFNNKKPTAPATSVAAKSLPVPQVKSILKPPKQGAAPMASTSSLPVNLPLPRRKTPRRPNAASIASCTTTGSNDNRPGWLKWIMPPPAPKPRGGRRFDDGASFPSISVYTQDSWILSPACRG